MTEHPVYLWLVQTIVYVSIFLMLVSILYAHHNITEHVYKKLQEDVYLAQNEIKSSMVNFDNHTNDTDEKTEDNSYSPSSIMVFKLG